MTTKLKRRIGRIQSHLGLRPDGLVGPVTVSRLEEEFGLEPPRTTFRLEVSKRGIDQLVRFEVSSEAYYRRRLQVRSGPGG